jgi:hypothetical protein
LLAILALSGFLLGCTPEKAQALRTAATQFKSEALAAVNLIELLMSKETEPPPRTDNEAAEVFATKILDPSNTEPLDEEAVIQALDPDAVTPDPQLEAKRQQFLGELRNQYSTFAAIFDELEAGSVLARDAVKRSGKHADALTVQMASFARSISENPPRLLQHRSSLVSKMEAVRVDTVTAAEERRRALTALREQWLLMVAGEQELQRSVIEQCLKAAIVGKEVSRLIREYDRLSLEDLNFFINRALGAAGQLSGNNLEALQAKVSEVLAGIQEDPELNALAGAALEKINGARRNR